MTLTRPELMPLSEAICFALYGCTPADLSADAYEPSHSGILTDVPIHEQHMAWAKFECALSRAGLEGKVQFQFANGGTAHHVDVAHFGQTRGFTTIENTIAAAPHYAEIRHPSDRCGADIRGVSVERRSFEDWRRQTYRQLKARNQSIDDPQTKMTGRSAAKRGRRPAYPWQDCKSAFLERLDYMGMWAADAEEGWRQQADAEKWVIAWFQSQRIDEPADSTVRGHVGTWRDEWLKSKGSK